MGIPSHRRTHNLLLLSKLLNQHDSNTSPFTLVLDTIEQPAKPQLREYLRRAKVSRCHTIYLAFESLKPPQGVDVFVRCFDKTPGEVGTAVSRAINACKGNSKRFLLLIDSLWMLASHSTTHQMDEFNLTAFLSSLLTPPAPPAQAQAQAQVQPQISLVAVYHSDIPLDPASNLYTPTPLVLLSYLATTIITVHSLSILYAEQRAREKSLAPPVFGWAEERDGVVIGLKPSIKDSNGVVLELEHRRKSGRGVREWFFLPSTPPGGYGGRENVVLLDDHRLFQSTTPETLAGEGEEGLVGMTFELGLTERQRREREGVILPYFDAQKVGDGGDGGGVGEGGRILYDMGVEDDFDEEEDEI